MASGNPHALPTWYELEANAAWRSIEFISDLHLSESQPRTVAAWDDYLAHSGACLLYTSPSPRD